MVTLNNIADTHAKQSAPGTKYAKSTSLALRESSSDALVYTQLSSSLGLPLNSTPTRLYIRYTNRDLWAGSTTLTAKRITAKWITSKLKWSNKPATTDVGAVAVTRSDAAAGSEWLFDVTDLCSADLIAGTFYGVRIETNNSSLRYLNSAEAKTGKPTYEFEWTTAPAIPTILNPTAARAVSIAQPTFQFNYSDSASGKAMAGYQLQLKYGADNFTSPSFDSGQVSSGAPEHKFTSDLTANTDIYWRVKVWSTSGEDSDWSASARTKRTAKGTLTIVAPAAAPNDFVEEYTPPKAWSYSGTQTAFQIIDTDSVITSKVYADTLRQVGTDTDYTSAIPQVFTSSRGRTVYRVWDNVNRATTPGDPPYIEASRTFTLVPSATTTPVTGLTATTDVTPAVVLGFSRTTNPDSFTIKRSDGKIVTGLDPFDLLVAGTAYTYTDVTAPPRTSLTYTVIPVVNGKAASANPTATITMTPRFIWLLDPEEPDWWIAVADQDSGSWGMGEQSAMTEIIGSDRLILSTQALRGYEGSLSGGLYSRLPGLDDLTAQELRDRAWHLKQNPTRTYRLVLSDLNIPVVVRAVVVAPTPAKELDYGFSCEFYQQGEIPWTV